MLASIQSTANFTRIFSRNFTTKRIQASYNVLRVNKDFTPEQIRAKYLKLVRIYHPDNSETGNVIKFRQIVEAYERIRQHLNGPESIPEHNKDVPDAFDPRFSEEAYLQLMRKRTQQKLDLFEKSYIYSPQSPAYNFWSWLKYLSKL